MKDNLKVTLGCVPNNSIEENAVEILDFSITYGQNPDTNSDRDEYQTLRISAKNNGVGEDGWYYDLEIPEGHWSISNENDLSEILKDFKTRMELNITKEKDLKIYQRND